MTISSMDTLVSAMATVQNRPFYFYVSSAPVANAWYMQTNASASTSLGVFTTPTAYTSGGTTHNQDTTFDGHFIWTAGSGTTSYVSSVSLTGPQNYLLYFYDMLWSASGFSGAVNTAQSVVGFAGLPTRASTGSGVEIWIGCSSAIGATAHNVTVQYTNSAGTSGRSTVSIAGIASMGVGRIYRLPLASGDQGVQSVQSLTLSASSGTAGNLWVMLVKKVCFISLPIAPAIFTRDYSSLNLPVVSDTSVITPFIQMTATTTGSYFGEINIIQG